MSDSENSEDSNSVEHNNEPQFQTEKGRELLKDVVTGWAVIRTSVGANGEVVYQKPLVAEAGGVVAGEKNQDSYFMGDASISLNDGEDVIDVIPAEPGIRLVWGPKEKNDNWVQIGIEYPDASNPDWDMVIDRMRD